MVAHIVRRARAGVRRPVFHVWQEAGAGEYIAQLLLARQAVPRQEHIPLVILVARLRMCTTIPETHQVAGELVGMVESVGRAAHQAQAVVTPGREEAAAVAVESLLTEALLWGVAGLVY